MINIYNLIIADDEEVIAKGISHIIDYEALGIKVVDICQNGEQLFSQINKIGCDIVITDISMPKMSGLDVFKAVKDVYKDIKFIFISGFLDFDYVQEALRLGAVDYITKPVKREDLKKAILKALDGMVEKNRKIRDAIMDFGTMEISEPSKIEKADQEYYTIMNIFAPDFKKSRESELIKFSIMAKVESMVLGNSIVFVKEKYVCVVINHPYTLRNNLRILAKEIIDSLVEETGMHMTVLLGATVSGINNIQKSYDSARRLEKYLYFMSVNTVIDDEKKVSDDSCAKSFEQIEKSLPDMLAGDKELLLKTIIRAERIIFDLSYGNSNLCKNYFSMLLKMLLQRYIEYVRCDNSDMKQLYARTNEKIISSEYFIEDSNTFRSFILLMNDRISKTAVLSTIPIEIKNTIEFIRRHYMEDITLEIVAGRAYMNSFYFSSFFKKHTGTNFKAYVDNVRLENAERLFLTSGLNVSEVAEKSGFKNLRSFNKVFKERYGMTPQQYKKEKLTKNKLS